ncbi:GGDEF domain-containing protein [Quadrisphaera sp. INWT6]|nr:GGDEF domain-containing protein [Quadrisphaera sp. INWT6]
MPLPTTLRARHPRPAARTAAAVLAAGAAVLLLYSFIDPATPTLIQRGPSWAVAAAAAALAAWCWCGDADRLDRAGVITAAPALGTVLICAQAWHTGDVSASVQVFLALPVIAAATQLRAGGAALAVATAVAGDLVLTTRFLPLSAALTDVVFVGTTLAVVSLVLVRLLDVQEADKAELARLAAVDTLTGLVTRRVLDDALAASLSSAASAAGTALVLVDVDNFKTINDSHGHPVGDDALRHLARVLASCVRDHDAVISRMGGDELAVLLPGCSAQVAAARAGDLVQAVRDRPLVLPDGTSLVITVSVGVAQVPRHAMGLRELYAAADAALYRAKRGGRDQHASAMA